jgi:4-hydroxy-3-methylbut-2-enyl diphosphate reductase IspH
MHIRYDNIRELQHTDLLIVVGDPRSNNVNQLLNLAKYYKIKAHLITNLEEIKASIFKDVKNLSVVSGTSVDQKHVEAVVDKIKAIVK